MIIITKVSCIWGPTKSYIYDENHPKYDELKEKLLKVSDKEPIATGYYSVFIDNFNFCTNLISNLPTPSRIEIIKDI